MLTGSANPDKIPHHVAFYLGVCSLPKYPPRVLWSIKGYICNTAEFLNCLEILVAFFSEYHLFTV